MANLPALIGILLVFLVQPAAAADTLFVFRMAFGSFDDATRITIGPAGRIYVIDAKKSALVIFKSPEETPAVLGGYGWSDVTFDRPTGVATDGLNIYVSDYGNHRVQRFDRYSNLISSLVTRDTVYTPAQFGYPTGVALSNQGDLLILDSENLRVVEFSADSRFERDFGGLNTAGGKLQDPIKICSVADQLVYVLEKKNVVEFDFYGNYLRTIAQGLSGDIVGGAPTSSGITVVAADTLYWFNAEGALQSKTPIGNLLADQPIKSVQDIAFVDNQLFMLTPHQCFIFRMEQGPN